MHLSESPSTTPRTSARRGEGASARTFGEYSWAVCSVYLLASLCYLALPWTGYVFSAMVFLLAIVLAGLRWQRGPVLGMATLSALVWNFLFIPPKFTLHIEKPEDAIMFGLFFLVALSMGHLTSRLHEREQSLERQRLETQALLQVLEKLVLSLDSSEGFDAAVEAMKEMIGADLAVFGFDATKSPPLVSLTASRFRPTPEEWEAVEWCARHGKPAGSHMEMFPHLETSWLPIDSQRGRIGVVGFLWQGDSPPDFSTRRMMEALTLQLALVVERRQVSEDRRKTELLIQSEKIHRALFDSVSHELKTPIAVIRAALGALPVSDPYLYEIRTATQRLQRIVEHLLEISRLESGRFSTHRDWTDFSDILEVARRILGTEWPGHLSVADEIASLPLLKLDSRLLAQAVANIVHNAAFHTRGMVPISLDARVEDNQSLIVTIRDRGPGIPPGCEEQIFEKFFRAPGAPVGGTGLGLPIARGLIRAQGGDVRVRNHPEGGAEFEIRLPTEIHSMQTEKRDE